MFELGLIPVTLRGEELVQIELVELTAGCDLTDLIGHLIGHQHHAWQRFVRILPLGRLPPLLGPLLVGIRPVEDLFFDELAVDDRAERRA